MIARALPLMIDEPQDLGIGTIFRYGVLGLLPSLAASSIIPFLSTYLFKTLEVSPSEIGWLLGASSTFAAAFSIASGKIVDRFDRRFVARAGSVMLCALPLVMVLSGGPSAIATALLMTYIGSSLFGSTVSNLIYTELSGTLAPKAYSYYYAAHNSGIFLSPLLVFLLGYDRMELIFRLSLFLNVGIVLCFWHYVKNVKARTEQSQPDHQGRLEAAIPALWACIAFGACYSLIYQQYFTNIPLAIGDVKIFNREVYPVLVAINGFLVVIFQLIYVQLCDRFRSLALLRFGVVSVMASLVVLLVASHSASGLIVFASLFSFGEALINPAIVSVLMQVAPNDRKASWLGAFAASRLVSGLSVAAGAQILGHAGAAVFLWVVVIGGLPLTLMTSLLPRYLRNRTPRLHGSQ